MLLLREEHSVIGLKEDDFEDAVRDEWMPALAKSEDARLLYYAHLAHGSGLAYRVVTYTLLRDAAAWGRLVDRVHNGDLQSLAVKLDDLRYGVESKQLLPLPWSKVQQIEIEEVPIEPGEHELSVFMEDTVWPFQGKLEEYIRRSGEQYSTEYDKSFPDTPKLLEIEASYRTAYGSHRRAEIVLWQKVLRPEGLLNLITQEMPRSFKKPGRWMLDALSLRDQWQSCLLRTASWSPRF
ncbi:MAG: hypothetical protein HRU01_25275 [Myxococcales bacterium]|nr:hypothetical protein [Myxococcales bacterium]